MSIPMPTDGNKYQWNPYAESWDLVADSAEDLTTLNDAASAVRDALDSFPGWVGDFFMEAIEKLDNAVVEEPRLRHTVNGKTSDKGWPYGTTHDMNCPACVESGSSFTASPRSETYWSS